MTQLGDVTNMNNLGSPEVSIGILAHNEEARIVRTLNSLFKQDIFKKLVTELVIVANGCTDRTAEVAKSSIDANRVVWSETGSARVEQLRLGGKANAWNRFVHQLSAATAPILVLMDADICLERADVISSMIVCLRKNSAAVVCIDRPIKDIERKKNKSTFEKLLTAATPNIDSDNLPLCGQLYCVLRSAVRDLQLPNEITCEDGFLRAMLLTDGFTMPEDRRRIVLEPSASHLFEAVASLRELFNHERWVVSGSIIDMLLFERFSAQCSVNCSAMQLMRKWMDEDPDWLPHYIESEVRSRGWALLPQHWWTRRWSSLGGQPLSVRLRRLHVVAMAALMDYVIFVAAIRDVRGGKAFRYWGRAGARQVGTE